MDDLGVVYDGFYNRSHDVPCCFITKAIDLAVVITIPTAVVLEAFVVEVVMVFIVVILGSVLLFFVVSIVSLFAFCRRSWLCY